MYALTEGQWQELMAILEAPVRDLPKLRKLMSSKSPFADD